MSRPYWRPKRMLAIGCAAGIGRWLIDQVFFPPGDLDICIADVDPTAIDRLQPSLAAGSAVLPSGSPESWAEVILAKGSFDVVMVAVPQQQLSVVCERILARLPAVPLIFDTGSEKSLAIGQLERSVASQTTLIGTHPLFGPRIRTASGQIVVVCPHRVVLPAHRQWLLTVLNAAGLLTPQMSANQHDRRMAIVQSLTHSCLVGFAYAARQKLRGDGDALMDCATPPFRAIASFTGRLLGSPLRVYADIQRLDGAHALRLALVEGVKALDQAAERGPAAVVSWLEDLAEFIPVQLREDCAAMSDAETEAIQGYFAELSRRHDSRCLTLLAHRQTGQVHAGRVCEVTPSRIVLLECQTEVGAEPPRLVIAYDKESEEAAAAHGANLFSRKAGRLVRLHHRHVRLFGDNETLRWRQATLRPHVRHAVLRPPDDADSTALGEICMRLVPQIQRFSILKEGTFRARRELLVELTITGDVSPDPRVAELQRLLSLLGVQPAG